MCHYFNWCLWHTDRGAPDGSHQPTFCITRPKHPQVKDENFWYIMVFRIYNLSFAYCQDDLSAWHSHDSVDLVFLLKICMFELRIFLFSALGLAAKCDNDLMKSWVGTARVRTWLWGALPVELPASLPLMPPPSSGSPGLLCRAQMLWSMAHACGAPGHGRGQEEAAFLLWFQFFIEIDNIFFHLYRTEYFYL